MIFTCPGFDLEAFGFSFSILGSLLLVLDGASSLTFLSGFLGSSDLSTFLDFFASFCSFSAFNSS
jgi:hypothetical protein